MAVSSFYSYTYILFYCLKLAYIYVNEQDNDSNKYHGLLV